MTLLTKQCVICKEIKSLSEFSKQKDNRDKLKHYCKSCNSVKMKAWHAKNPSNNLLTRYGITMEQKAQMVKKQNNCCAICENVFKSSVDTHVDHCHNSQDIRGILCGHCNRALGLFKDSPTILRNAAKYLEKYAKPNTTPPVPKRTNLKGIDNSKPGAIPTARIRQDGNDFDHCSGAVQRQDINHSSQEGSGNSVGRRSQEVDTPQTFKSSEDIGIYNPTYSWLEY